MSVAETSAHLWSQLAPCNRYVETKLTLELNSRHIFLETPALLSTPPTERNFTPLFLKICHVGKLFDRICIQNLPSGLVWGFHLYVAAYCIQSSLPGLLQRYLLCHALASAGQSYSSFVNDLVAMNLPGFKVWTRALFALTAVGGGGGMLEAGVANAQVLVVAIGLSVYIYI